MKILAFFCSSKPYLLMTALFLAVATTGCSSKTQTVQFKINSQPEGSHVVFNMSGSKLDNSADWLYLGHTPIRGVRQIQENKIVDASKIALKVMHAGYYDQIREWDGPTFWEEAIEKGVVFWTPKLIQQPAQ
ncbi:MAG: hypothetical protein KAI39_09500 [Desulfobulbaceae bacterium]|nr:hypothetical protein [Desulfobulbaceae bacterium]